MTFLTVNYCKGISTIIHKQNNENGVLRIYHLSESTVIGALKEIKFQFMYVNFVYNKNVNRIFHVITNSNKIFRVCEIETANFLFFCPQIIQIQTDFMILNSMTSHSFVAPLLTVAKTIPKPYQTDTWGLFYSYIGHICTKCCIYLTNISPIYHKNQGHISVI